MIMSFDWPKQSYAKRKRNEWSFQFGNDKNATLYARAS